MSISKNFEDAIQVNKTSEGNFTANISDNWSIGQTANGGYSMSILAKACSEYLDHKDPLVLSANYIDRVEFGPADIEVSKVASTRSTSTAYVSLKQEGNLKIFSTVTFTDFSKMKGIKDNLRSEPKFDSYEGNGSSDGTFVHLGFRPAMVIFKRTDTAENWIIADNKRDTKQI